MHECYRRRSLPEPDARTTRGRREPRCRPDVGRSGASTDPPRHPVVVERKHMSDGGAPPGWYPDPASGVQRYFDSNTWTAHTAPTPRGGTAPDSTLEGRPVRPAPLRTGRVGRSREPLCRAAARRPALRARLRRGRRDHDRAGRAARRAALPQQSTDPNASTPTPGFVWLTSPRSARPCSPRCCSSSTRRSRRGVRTHVGQALDAHPAGDARGRTLGWGRSFGRAGMYALAGRLGWLDLVDFLWSAWDADSQCLHDKVVGTLVVRD